MERHDLVHEFPEYQEKIHQLKIDDPHFRELFDEYHELEHEIYRINTDVEITTDEYLHSLKAKFLYIKDELFSMLENN
ncbi:MULTISPECIES: YdcH family protein [unclassified Flavobacterium]|jgi:uncharacterized protein YdcH (DUF465 family)|uniref:YdcH family protein n=1 Tax=unclassified Flavobacterium TaxID=196869 RepID=UPI0025C7402A|nr:MULTISPECIES: DUF465 domain-containing protein [unclassified Flavobacterium]